jgi:hypothetical protein
MKTQQAQATHLGIVLNSPVEKADVILMISPESADRGLRQ